MFLDRVVAFLVERAVECPAPLCTVVGSARVQKIAVEKYSVSCLIIIYR